MSGRASTENWRQDVGKFKVGDKVMKPDGYPFIGVVRSVFTNSAGDTRLVVELSRGVKGDMLHIFSPKQLRHYAEDQ